MVLSPSTTFTTARCMLASAVPNEFFITAGIGVIFRIIGKTYSCSCFSSQRTTHNVCEVIYLTSRFCHRGGKRSWCYRGWRAESSPPTRGYADPDSYVNQVTGSHHAAGRIPLRSD